MIESISSFTEDAVQPGGREATVASRADLDQLGMGPLAFWFLNHDLEEPELRRQIGELKAKGFAGFFLHPRGGLRVPYGSRQWQEVIAFCVREARALGLEAWLYDEDPYPSGAAGGRVTMMHPEYRATELVPVVARIEASGPVAVDLPAGPLVAAYLVGEKVKRIDDDAGLIRQKWRQHFIASGYYPPYQGEGSPHWRAETTEPHYRITVDVPDGGATVVAFVRRTISQNPWGDYTDLLNVAAVRLFLRYTHDAYAELLGEECGATVPGIFTDEAKLKGRLPWSAKVPHWFYEVAGYHLMEVLPHLVLQLDERTPFFRWAYRKALARGLRESMVEPMVAACHRHRLLLTGHVSPEEDPIGQVIYIPGLMGVIGRMDLPGTDLIGMAVGSREQPLLHLSPKIASSAAHGYGKRWISCEAFAVCDWSQDLASLTRATHWLYALGVNRLVTHGQFYSIDGLRKREAPPSQFIQAAYWEHFGGFSGMVELLSRELSRGEHVAPLLVYYPEESFMATASGVEDNGKEGVEAHAMREALGALVDRLLISGYDFDFADEELLRSVRANGGCAVLRRERFEAVVVPGRYLSLASWEHLEKLASEGVAILYLEEGVTLLSPQPRVWATGGGWNAALEAIEARIRPLWKSTGRLVGHQRKTKEEMVLFLCNNDTRSFSGPVSLSFAGPYEICHPQEGVWRSIECLELELGAGLGVLIRQQGKEARKRDGESRGTTVEAVWGEWNTTPLTENCLVISEFRVCHGSGPELPGIGRFGAAPVVDLLSPTCLHHSLLTEQGDRYLLAGFDWRGGDAAVRLVCDTDLGEGEMAFYLNGHPLPPLVRRTTFDPMNREASLAAPLLRAGRNQLLWVQRRLGASPLTLPLPYDAVRLFGDFHVAFPAGRPMPALLTERPAQYGAGFPLAASQMGHPHYGGMLEYRSEVSFPGVLPSRLWLEVGHVYETMEVRINGRSVGCLWGEPWRVEVPVDVLVPGPNRVALICSCSPANYLQALPRPSGFLGPLRWMGA